MNRLYKLLAIVLLLSYATCSFAQSDTSGTEKKPFFKIGVSFLNNDVYIGRADTVATPTITPNFNYTFQNGVFVSGGLGIITNRKKNKLDNGNIEAGYVYSLSDNFEFGASVTKLFYNSTSTQVSSSISSIINAYAAYDVADIITPALSLNYNINKTGINGDFLLNPSLSHEFEIDGVFDDEDALKISPQAGLFAGSQNYYGGYQARKGRLAKSNVAAVQAAINNYDSALGDFKLLDYELSVPLEYTYKKFIFTFIPTYAFAQDSLPKSTDAEKLLTAAIEQSSPYKSSIFYFETGITFKF